MKSDGLRITESHCVGLENRWNEWEDKTKFLSTGNCDDETWDELVKFGKEHVRDSILFAIEYLRDIESSWPILEFVNACIDDPLKEHRDELGYVSPLSIGPAYLAWLSKEYSKYVDLFEGAKFGDRFITSTGKLATYISSRVGKNTGKLIHELVYDFDKLNHTVSSCGIPCWGGDKENGEFYIYKQYVFDYASIDLSSIARENTEFVKSDALMVKVACMTSFENGFRYACDLIK